MKKIKYIEFLEHPVLGNSKFHIFDEGEFNVSKYVTLILGQNGAGKSKVLEALSSILIFLKRKKSNIKEKWPYNFQFILELQNNEYINKIRLFDKQLTFSYGSIENIDEFLPDNLIVHAYTFNDKYQKLDEKFEFYIYSGLKTTTNNIFLNYPVEECLDNLIRIFEDPLKIDVLNSIFFELKFNKKISVSYIEGTYKKLLNSSSFQKIMKSISLENQIQNQHISDFQNLIKKSTKVFKKNKAGKYQDTAITRFLQDENRINDVLLYLSKNNILDKGPKNGLKINKTFEYSWEDNDSLDDFLVFIKTFKYLKELGIVKFDNFNVHRKNFFSFSDVSSGEFHFLHLFSGILANIQENSVLIIDEPEISLHPTWQNKFLYMLDPIMQKFPKSQFLIAAHSHLMVSSLDAKNSCIITMKKDSDGSLIINNLENINTFGWSAEQILFDVFEMVTDRNYYLSKLIQEIIDKMALSKPPKAEIEKLKEELKKHNVEGLNPDDPFNVIIESILR